MIQNFHSFYSNCETLKQIIQNDESVKLEIIFRLRFEQSNKKTIQKCYHPAYYLSITKNFQIAKQYTTYSHAILTKYHVQMN